MCFTPILTVVLRLAALALLLRLTKLDLRRHNNPVVGQVAARGNTNNNILVIINSNKHTINHNSHNSLITVNLTNNCHINNNIKMHKCHIVVQDHDTD